MTHFGSVDQGVAGSNLMVDRNVGNDKICRGEAIGGKTRGVVGEVPGVVGGIELNDLMVNLFGGTVEDHVGATRRNGTNELHIGGVAIVDSVLDDLVDSWRSEGLRGG